MILRKSLLEASLIHKPNGRCSKALLSMMVLPAAAALLSACQTSPVAPQAVSIAIENVTVIDPENRRVLPDHSVYVDGDRIVAVQQLAATGVYYTPTHVTREMEARADEASYRNVPERKYVAADRNAKWEADLNEAASLPAEQRIALDAFFTHGLLITGLAHKAGVPVMAGTDANDTMIVPGYSLHRELGLLKAAGFSNMDVLRAATTVPAAYLERTRDLGGISVGKRADLVLLRLDPLSDISNTASIDAVIVNGRTYGRAELDALLREVERLASESRQKS